MFLRVKRSRRVASVTVTGICRTVRTRAVRAAVVASLGKLDGGRWRVCAAGGTTCPRAARRVAAARRVTRRCRASRSAMPRRAAALGAADLRALRVERSRDFGECYFALSLWHRLGLDTLLAELWPRAASRRWAHTAALLTVARFARTLRTGVASIGMIRPRSTICSG